MHFLHMGIALNFGENRGSGNGDGEGIAVNEVPDAE